MNIKRKNGFPSDPKPCNRKIIKLECCPDCNGRGWFLINPFATGGSNGAGGVGNMAQCQTCERAKHYYDATGELPPDLKQAYIEHLEKKLPSR